MIMHPTLSLHLFLQQLEYTPEEKPSVGFYEPEVNVRMGNAGNKPEYYKGRTGKGVSDDADYFQNSGSFKVAPTVFDGTYALGSALLIAACGILTLLLRYCGNAFLD